MRDWRRLVQQRLAGLAIEDGEASQVFEELAAHLEEKYQSLLKEGISEEDAARRALDQAGDWNELAEKIVSAHGKEETMRDRLTRLWLPGLVSTILAMGSLTLIQVFAAPPMVRDYGNNAARLWLPEMLNDLLSIAHLALVQKFSTPPIVLDLGGSPVVILFLQWLLLLPVAGAVGAYFSKRAGGSRRLLLSSVFPALPFVAAFVCIIPASPFFDRHIAHHITPAGVLSFTFVWILLCASALLAGGLLVQFLLSPQATPREKATS